MNCGWVKSQITLYLYNELADSDRIEVEQHVERCPACTEELAREQRLHQVLSARPRPAVDPNLLAACRINLSEALEAEPKRAAIWAQLGALFGGLHLSLRPTLAALLVIAGFVGGWTVSSYREHIAARLPAVMASSLGGLNLANLSNIDAIRTEPDGRVVIDFQTTRHSQMQGMPDDPRIRQVLVYAATNYANPGVQLDSIDLLKNRTGDEQIRNAFIAALRTDQNPGVRRKALEALGGFALDEQVKQAFLDVLGSDSNAAMRREAINQLCKMQDRSTVPLLQQFAAGDTDSYVRLKSASKLREMNAPEIF